MIVLAPVSGRIVPLEEVPDEVFAQGMAGAGLAVVPEASGEAVAPVSGVLVKLFEGQALAEVTGYVLMPAGLVAGVFGVYRYLRVKARIETGRHD